MSEQEKIDVDYIAFFQTPYDRVKYLFPGMEKNVSMSYFKFKKWLFDNFFIKDRISIMRHLDSFDLIILLKSGDFQIVNDRKDPFNVGFGDLWKFNSNLRKEEEESPIQKKTEKGYDLLHEKVMNDFKKYISRSRRFGSDRKPGIIR